jgi:hypothetical protein
MTPPQAAVPPARQPPAERQGHPRVVLAATLDPRHEQGSVLRSVTRG